MDDVLKIKCPFCGAVLSVRPQPDMEGKSVTCPVCKHRNPFRSFKKAVSSSGMEQPETRFPDRNRPDYLQDHTEIGRLNLTVGRLIDPVTLRTYQLKEGRNVIGRKSPTTEADFAIDTGADRTMSREHIVIEVRNVPLKGIVHYVALYKENVNPTFIGDARLQFGDTIVLNHGDLVRLPGADLRFELPDEEATVI